MNLIVAILLYVGAIFSPDQVNEQVIDANQATIEHYSHDEEWLKANGFDPTIIMSDMDEGD